MKAKLFTFFAALLCATTAWATDYNVGTDSELREAIKTDDANITVTADIELSNSTLEIKKNTTVNIDLGGHTLNRKLTQRGDNGGQVITVRENAKLNLSNGTLKGGWGGAGGGILNEGGTVNLTSVIIKDNIGDDRGGGICNYGLLTMLGGAISGNTSRDKTEPEGGGGLFNAEGATAMLTGVKITGNEAKVKGGGGICNYGTLNILGGAITGNTCGKNGGGIWNGEKASLTVNDITVTGNTAGERGGGIFDLGTLNMRGAVTVTDNTTEGGLASNVYLLADKVITVIGTLTGSSVGISMASPAVFTSGYSSYNSGTAPTTIFTQDMSNVMAVSLDGDEVKLYNTFPQNYVYYVERSWDDENKKVVATIKTVRAVSMPTYTPDPDRITTYQLDESYYAVYGNVTQDKITMSANESHIILCDGAHLSLNYDIHVPEGHTLYIHDQGYGSNMGRLTNADDRECTSIGGIQTAVGDVPDKGGNIEIHGGDIHVKSAGGAAIGGSYRQVGTISIYGGKVRAEGAEGAAGIGGGDYAKYGNIRIYGGTIQATGGANAGPTEFGGGAGIGGGKLGGGGTIHIYGGDITANTLSESAGIGTSQYTEYGSGTIIIDGGTVRAYGGKYAAGIGGGDGIDGADVTINGGEVYAYGGTDAAGIGGGEGGNGGKVTITGGYVYAEGKSNGAGIGGGEDGKGANVTITGGTVVVQAGGDQRAIGAGYGKDNHGSLTFADNLGVFTTINLYRSQKANRVSDCRNFSYVRINKCAHGKATSTIIDGYKHSITECPWCLVTGEEAHAFEDYGQCTACGLISLADEADNTETISHWAEENGSHSVVLSGRTLKKGAWNTLCLPFNVSAFEGSPLEDATVKTLNTTAFDNGTLTMNFSNSSLTSIEAGKPYIVKWGSGNEIENPVFTNVTINNTTNNVETQYVDFIGIYDPKTSTEENKSVLYLGNDNKLYYPSQAMTINAFRAYFTVDLGGASIKEFKMYFGPEDEETSIDNVQCSMFNVQSENIYNLSGQRLSKPQKGINIINGKKILF